jgi:alkanesulfonate monooxygenase SsuD/methylene tetrahydromethanopterin reductase-like flavin-dependent oxidoreductase (luciferase family)
MKVGLFITNQQTLDTDMVSALDDQFAMVRLARDCGWDSLFSGQHYLNEGNNKQLQTVPLLARLAAEAGEMTIGLGILLLNLHNPVYTAETVATLDIIARGNFIFGVGLGYRDIEFDAFGVPKGERVKRLEEYLTLVERLWTEDRVSYEGPGCRLDNVHMNIRPVQKPRPPIWMAANNDPAVKRAARMADAWFINPHATSDTIRRQMAVYRAELDAAGKGAPRELPVIKEVYCAKDRATALEMAGPYLLAKYRDYAKWGQDKVMPDDTDFNRPLEELIKRRFILGSPEDCYDGLKPYWEEFGVNHIIIRTHWVGMPLSTSLASMRLISDELLPALQGVSPGGRLGSAPAKHSRGGRSSTTTLGAVASAVSSLGEHKPGAARPPRITGLYRPHFRYDLNYRHFAGLRSLTSGATSGHRPCPASQRGRSVGPTSP